MASRLKEKYTAEIAPALNKKFGYKSVMQIPKLSKVIVNVGCGESKNNAKEIEAICKDIATITLFSAGIATRTLPLTPLSLPDRTITVSFFLMFILGYLH